MGPCKKASRFDEKKTSSASESGECQTEGKIQNIYDLLCEQTTKKERAVKHDVEKKVQDLRAELRLSNPHANTSQKVFVDKRTQSTVKKLIEDNEELNML